MLDKNETYNAKLKMYLAGPLFSLAERTFNQNLKQLLSSYFDVYLPQEDGGLIINMIKAGLPPKLASQKVFDIDIRAMNECDVFLIILDGRSVDEGAAFELGFAHAKGKPCYGLKTDFRQLLAFGNNPMIDGPIKKIFENIEELLDWAKSNCDRGLNSVDNEAKDREESESIKTEAKSSSPS
jgi:nucleoside 2-deoxyribosyltransferase